MDSDKAEAVAVSKHTSHNLTPDEYLEFREIFNLVDRDFGGSISNEELGELMDTLGINATQDEIDKMIQEIDEDNNGEIDFDEFVAVMSRKVQGNYSSEQVKNAFKVFEGTDGALPWGCIPYKNVEDGILSFSKDKTRKEVKAILSQLPVDGEGNINYVDYVDLMMAD